jgi:uncharacterized SAM-binding protein YcdF (DUF218 family)
MTLFELKAVLRTLVLPPAAPLILAVVGLLLASRRRWRTVGIALCAVAIAALWLLATPAVAGQLMKWVGRYPALDLRQPVAAQAVVILAGGVRRYAPEYNDDAPNETTLMRLVYGARVARTTGLPVLVTGGPVETRVMRELLVKDFGITPRWVEDQSLDTRDNAVFAAQMLKAADVGTVVLVTSALHIPRAVAEFRSQGLTVVAAPVTDYAPSDGRFARWIPGVGGLRDSRNALYELLGDAVRRIRSD